MIGGIDIRIPSAAGNESLEKATRAVAQYWPDAVFGHGETGELYQHAFLVPFSELDEIFVYRDDKYANLWLEQGAVQEAYNSMVHILYDPGLLTVVIDERNEEMDMALKAIKSSLADYMHSTCAT